MNASDLKSHAALPGRLALRLESLEPRLLLDAAALTVLPVQWGVSTQYIGAVEGSARFDVTELVDCGVNTFRIYGDMARFEPVDDDGVYGSPTIDAIKADPDVIPWDHWDSHMDAPTAYAYSDVPSSIELSNREQFAALDDAGIRTVVALRNRDTVLNPSWSPAVPTTQADWNEWWEYCFAMAYWLNVRNDYGVDDYEVLNEPDIYEGQGWTGTLAQYYDMVTQTKDAIDYVYTTYLPGRTYHIYAPVAAGNRTWITGALDNVADSFDSLDVHSYASNLESFIREMHGYLDSSGHPDYPLWITEWGTYWSTYDDVGMGLQVASNLIRGSRPGDDYVYGSHIFAMYGWGSAFEGVVSADGVPSATYYAMRLTNRALQGGRPTYETTDDSADLLAITTTDPDGTVNLLVVNNSSTTSYSVGADLSGLLGSGTGVVQQFSSGVMDEVVGGTVITAGLSSFDVPASSAVLVQYSAGRDYYVSPSGNDANPGTIGEPWQTVAMVNATDFEPGDRVLFEGGATFSGTVVLDTDDDGGPGSGLVIGSYGTGWATIDGGSGRGFTATDTDYMTINGLNFVGAGRKTGNTTCGVYIDGGTGVTVDQVDISGFQHSGLEIGGATDVSVTNVYAHENGFAGISIGSYIPKWSENVYIGYSVAENNPGDPTILNNHSGNGIIVGYAINCLVEYCEAMYNGWDMPRQGNGPVGIWAWNSNGVTIQHNVSHHNMSPGLDGGGFDLDGGVTNGVLQYNLSFENEGYGYLLCQYDGANDLQNLTVRYNISQNDQYGICVAAGDPNVSGMEIYNNTIYNASDLAVGLFRWSDGDWSDVNFYNNIFVTQGQTVSGVTYRERFENNLYWSVGSATGFWVGGYTTIEAWAAATGQEMVGGEIVGLVADPLLVGMGATSHTDPLTLHELAEYRLQPGSPAIDAGMLIPASGGVDLWGHAVPLRSAPDIGAYEYPNTAPTLSAVSDLPGAFEDQDFTIAYADLAAAADEVDADGDVVSFRVESVTSGTLTKDGSPVVPGVTLLSPGESLVWHAEENANGTLAAFAVRASDGWDLSGAPVQASAVVAAVNDAPVANPDGYAVAEDGTLVVDAAGGVLANDGDVDG
ncbi:MAG: right-handed parallel beta-helix repeat-containing protein, partial [Planctomycetota bacterium]